MVKFFSHSGSKSRDSSQTLFLSFLILFAYEYFVFLPTLGSEYKKLELSAWWGCRVYLWLSAGIPQEESGRWTGVGAEESPRSFVPSCPVLGLMLSWPGQHFQPLWGHRAAMSVCSEPGFGAVPSQGRLLPTLGLRWLFFLMLEEGGETRWGPGPLLILFRYLVDL